MESKRNKSLLLIVGSLIIFIGICIIITDYCTNKVQEQKDNNEIEEFFEISTTEEVEIVPQNQEESKVSYSINYIAILEIPSINLKRGLVEYGNYYNNVKYNVEILKDSTMPDVLNGNLILAGHNGSGYASFFKNLNKLNVGDDIFVYYNGYKYHYILSNNYEVNKNGSIQINRDKERAAITLITCKKNSKDTQVVYIGYLDNKTTY